MGLCIDHSEHTMITNFGKHNIWDFDDLAKVAQDFKCWQIQLTMGDQMLNPEGIKHLRSKISDCNIPNNGTAIALADNLQVCHKCMAGINGCSITYNGDVIACLSERSYGGIQKVYGSLLKSTIGEIWENGFKDIRFNNCRKCCREFVKYPEIDPDNKQPLPPTIIIEKIKDYKPDPYPPNTIIMYGVVDPSSYIYSVVNPNIRYRSDDLNP
jgi:MoaA/NifB/PqqE/SkfB family radical SAM enzyme